LETFQEQAVRLGIALPDPAGLSNACEKCGKRHPALCRVSPLPDKAGVVNEASVLEREQFGKDDEERERITELRVLSAGWELLGSPKKHMEYRAKHGIYNDQVADDVYSMVGAQRDRMGEHGVQPRGEGLDDGERMWAPRSEEQLALERGFESFLGKLTADQRVVVRMRYGAQMTEREIAKVLTKTQQAVHNQLNKIHATVNRLLTEAFEQEEDA
jgi:RNA polymerase sigma factor (sigma-70 family)